MQAAECRGRQIESSDDKQDRTREAEAEGAENLAPNAAAWQPTGAGDDPLAGEGPLPGAAHSEPHAGDEIPAGEPGHDAPARRLAFSAAFFSIATGLSRVAGLIREIVAARYFGVSGAASAFTIAFNVPNLIRALFADAALQAAFVPVFTEMLEQGRRREAFRLASTMFYVILIVLGAVTSLFILLAPWIMPVFAKGFDSELTDLTVGLSQVLFPIVVLLGLTGLFVGILNSFDHFEIPAIAPLFWNIVIIAAIVGLVPVFPEDTQIYAYAIGVLLGTVVQMLMPLPLVRKKASGEGFGRAFDWRDPNVKRVLLLMLPVTIALGLINFNLTINNFFGSFVSESAPAAIDKAFRVFMLPQGMFSVAIATILFPTMSRFAARGDIENLRSTMANGVRQVFMLLVPAAVASAVLAVPIVRLIYQRGAFDAEATDLVAEALIWFSFSLPFSGANLMFARTFFALKRPWVTTAISVGNLVINAVLAYLLYEPYGVAGIVAATGVATVAMALTQALYLRGPLGGIEGQRTAIAIAKMIVASALLAVLSYGVWYVFDDALGREIWAQVVSLTAGLTAGAAAYFAAVYVMRIPEARQITGLIAGRLKRG
ncbi:MAG: murein biosynthesis integral membrane protein MurJ [Actinobacteria bacterium]|nr:murein biosynthesis integral membrane protein MurJ [Actinomycetota bacterium]